MIVCLITYLSRKCMGKFEERNSITLENNGQKIFGMLHLPLVKNQEQVPAVLMCHGFGGNKTGKFRIYVSLAQRLAEMGIASFRFDFRGSGDSEGDFKEMTVESEVSDALIGLEYLNSHPLVDSNRIGMLGNSFGAAISVLAASKYEKVKSLVLLAALFSSNQWKSQWEAIQSKGSDSSLKEIMKAFDGNIPGTAFFKSFFQMNIEPHLATLQKTPLLHIHSLCDERISMTEADQYARCREKANSETRYIRLEKCDHSFSHPEERLMIIEEAAQWFKKTL